jgi:hypothetical protein
MGSSIARQPFTKQVSRPGGQSGSPIVAARRRRSSELEERPSHEPDPRFLCPTRCAPALRGERALFPSAEERADVGSFVRHRGVGTLGQPVMCGGPNQEVDQLPALETVKTSANVGFVDLRDLGDPSKELPAIAGEV